MAAVNLTDVATQTGVAKVGRIDAGDTVSRRFAAAMEKAGTDPAVDPQRIGAASRVLPSGQATPVDPAASATADAQERTRRALNLNPSHSVQQKPVHGDAILNGLQNVRGIFGAQEARINALASHSVDTSGLLAMQVEVAKWSVLVETGAKLTGKLAQLSETLLKGR
ncbi:MAG: hypothetical protein WBZ28_18290 [Pseudolabrys sp.]